MQCMQALRVKTEATSLGSSQMSSHILQVTLAKKQKGLAAILKNATSLESTSTESMTFEQRLLAEMDCYRVLPEVEMDIDSLAWWKIAQQDLPILSVLSKKYLGVCGTSVPSKTYFFTSWLYYQ